MGAILAPLRAKKGAPDGVPARHHPEYQTRHISERESTKTSRGCFFLRLLKFGILLPDYFRIITDKNHAQNQNKNNLEFSLESNPRKNSCEKAKLTIWEQKVSNLE